MKDVNEYYVFTTSSYNKYFKKNGEIYKFTDLKEALKANFNELNEFIGEDALVVYDVREFDELERDCTVQVCFMKSELAHLYATDYVTLKME